MNCSKSIDNLNATKCKQCRLVKRSVRNIKSLNLHTYFNFNINTNIKHIINKRTSAESAVRHSRDEVRTFRLQVFHHKVKNRINSYSQLANSIQSPFITKIFIQADSHVHTKLNLESKEMKLCKIYLQHINIYQKQTAKQEKQDSTLCYSNGLLFY